MTSPPADELYVFPVTIPAATLAAAPQVTSLAMPERVVTHIDLMFPPGPNGQVGVALGLAGQPILPTNAGAWIIANGETVGRDFANLPESGAWQMFGYNTGVNPHTVHVRFYVAVVRPSVIVPAAPLPDLSGMTSYSSASVAAFIAAAEASAAPVGA